MAGSHTNMFCKIRQVISGAFPKMSGLMQHNLNDIR